MDFLNQLKEKKIISQKDIDKFKSYIDEKYEAFGDEKKHAILKNSITYVVNRDLAELKIDDEEGFVSSLVQKTLLEDKEDLCADKILQKVVLEGEHSDGLLQSVTKWVSDKIEIPLHKDILEKYYHDHYYFDKDIALQENPALPLPTLPQGKASRWIFWCAIAIMIFLSVSTFKDTIFPSDNLVVIQEDLPQEELFKNTVPAYVLQKYHMPNRNFPHYLYYRDINEDDLKSYLSSRNSLLGKEPYFSQVLDTAKEFDLNPLLLFAIAGHEQAFVPQDHPNSEVMINNPFNVFGSWQKYNTNLKETSEIAARTVFNSLGDLPPFMDPFFWMNHRYAEDPNWWRGIRSIFWRLEKEC
ncbi:hypothetical protein [Anaerovirgula multivorans]|nr:hypothetical protein [Anaerovirgula multivorans]